MNKNIILIYAEITPDLYIHTVVFELIQKAIELSKSLENPSIELIMLTPQGIINEYKEAIENNGIDKVYVLENENFRHYSTEYYSKAIIPIIEEIQPEIFLLGATNQGRDLAPRISSSLHTGLTADCIELQINEKGLLAATRPTFGGQLMATILCKNKPQMATVRPKVFKPLANIIKKETQYIYKEVNLSSINPQIELIDIIKKAQTNINDLDSSDIIVAGGKGMKSKEGFELLKEFAQAIGGTVGASRGAVDIGIAPQEIQIGQTGKTVSPKLYIACGISGAIQHIVGMNNSDKVIVINSDSNAPIFDNCDYGIVGDAFDIIPKLTNLIKQK